MPNENANHSLPDYKDDPEAYELAERARPDEMLMIRSAAQEARRILSNFTGAKLLDMCCGTGLSLEGVIDHPSLSHVAGVDISPSYLEFATRRLQSFRTKPILVNGDAVAAPLPSDAYDVVLMVSAYHHIEDERKVAFLCRVGELIGENGRAVVGENILPSYVEADRNSYRAAVSLFYKQVLKSARIENPTLPQHVANLIRRVAQYGHDGEYEYKVSLPVFRRDVSEAGLEIERSCRVWPRQAIDEDGGNYVFVLKRKS